MNSMQLIGRLTRDPENRDADSGTQVCRMRVAVPGRGRTTEPVYVDVVCFDAQAAACERHLSKGDRIGVEGRLDYSEWEAADGSKRSKHEVIARRIEFLGAPGRSDPALDARADDTAADPHADRARPKDAIPF